MFERNNFLYKTAVQKQEILAHLHFEFVTKHKIRAYLIIYVKEKSHFKFKMKKKCFCSKILSLLFRMLRFIYIHLQNIYLNSMKS